MSTWPDHSLDIRTGERFPAGEASPPKRDASAGTPWMRIREWCPAPLPARCRPGACGGMRLHATAPVSAPPVPRTLH